MQLKIGFLGFSADGLFFLLLLKSSFVKKKREFFLQVANRDMGRTLRGGSARKIKACMALVDVHRKTLYSTKYNTFLITLSLQSI